MNNSHSEAKRNNYIGHCWNDVRSKIYTSLYNTIGFLFDFARTSSLVATCGDMCSFQLRDMLQRLTDGATGCS